MSWSTSSIAWPAVDEPAQPPAELLALVRVEPGGRLVEADEARLRRRAPARCRRACAAPATARSAARPRSPPARAARASARSPRSRCAGAETDLLAACATTEGDARRRAGSRARVRSSKSSIDCHVRASPSRARACGGRPVRSWPSSSTRPRDADEAGDRVDEGRLAGAVRADQADELARADLEVDVDDGVHPAEAHRDPVALRTGVTAASAPRSSEPAQAGSQAPSGAVSSRGEQP